MSVFIEIHTLEYLVYVFLAYLLPKELLIAIHDLMFGKLSIAISVYLFEDLGEVFFL